MFSYGFPLVFICVPMVSYVFLWFSYVFYGFPMFSYGFPMFEMEDYGPTPAPKREVNIVFY